MTDSASAAPIQTTVTELCRCSGSITITAVETLPAILTVVQAWRVEHSCTREPNDHSTGGASSFGFAPGRTHEAAGHIELQIRA
jgi:hypothetical protein